MYVNRDCKIMTGNQEHLGWVCRSLRISGVAAMVKTFQNGIIWTYSALVVPKKDEQRARRIAREYVASCNALRFVEMDVQEVGNYETDENFLENMG